MNEYEKTAPQRNALLSVMKQGKYYEAIMDAGPELERIKQFLLMMDGKQPLLPEKPYQWPTFLPIFPGLNASAYHSRNNDKIAQYLENSLDLIREEALSVKELCLQNKHKVSELLWRVYPLWYMGVRLDFLLEKIPNIKKIANEMPRSAQLFPFAESMISWLGPKAHLKAHSSTDGLRVRYSLGLVIDDYCELRVSDIKKTWTQGECIIFEDCFEHEAWNGTRDRAVFIIDTWHPDLTDIEIEVLLAGFRKREVREILFNYRSIEETRKLMYYTFQKEDAEISDKYWNRNAKIIVPELKDVPNWKDTPRFEANQNNMTI